jgi:LSD1 subclass zinc finger protein
MNTEKQNEHCMVCRSPLHYLQVAENLLCTYCGANERGHVKCERGHFVCEACHRKDAMAMIEEIVLNTHLKDPAGIAELMMSHPGLPMLGCEHAFIAAGALMAALRNSPYGAGKITSADIREVFERTNKQAVSGYCGLTGVCGIAPALGACFSSFLGSRCGSDTEQKITMETVIKVMRAIADVTGPSCCKAYVRNAVRVAVAVLGERFGILLPLHDASVVCLHATKHPHGCREEKCPFYQEPARDLFAESIHPPVAACQS